MKCFKWQFDIGEHVCVSHGVVLQGATIIARRKYLGFIKCYLLQPHSPARSKYWITERRLKIGY